MRYPGRQTGIGADIATAAENQPSKIAESEVEVAVVEKPGNAHAGRAVAVNAGQNMDDRNLGRALHDDADAGGAIVVAAAVVEAGDAESTAAGVAAEAADRLAVAGVDGEHADIVLAIAGQGVGKVQPGRRGDRNGDGDDVVRDRQLQVVAVARVGLAAAAGGQAVETGEMSGVEVVVGLRWRLGIGETVAGDIKLPLRCLAAADIERRSDQHPIYRLGAGHGQPCAIRRHRRFTRQHRCRMDRRSRQPSTPAVEHIQHDLVIDRRRMDARVQHQDAVADLLEIEHPVLDGIVRKATDTGRPHQRHAVGHHVIAAGVFPMHWPTIRQVARQGDAGTVEGMRLQPDVGRHHQVAIVQAQHAPPRTVEVFRCVEGFDDREAAIEQGVGHERIVVQHRAQCRRRHRDQRQQRQQPALYGDRHIAQGSRARGGFRDLADDTD